MKYFDLSFALCPQSLIFPGDPLFEAEPLLDVAKGDAFCLSHFRFGNHTGTHIDFPAHVIANGQNSDAYPLSYLLGSGVVIEIPQDRNVMVKDIEKAALKAQDMVFIKTYNTRRRLQHKGEISDQFASIDLDAASLLVAKGIKLVAIDYLSVDQLCASDLPVHHQLLSHGVLIVENANLETIEPGRYHFSIMPLKVAAQDGLPVRIMAQAL